jgi:hypothetical protein
MLLNSDRVHSKGASDDTAQQKNTDYVRDKERRQQAARLKKLVYGSAFSGIPILRQLDVTAPSYWLSSAALVRGVVLFVARCPSAMERMGRFIVSGPEDVRQCTCVFIRTLQLDCVPTGFVAVK